MHKNVLDYRHFVLTVQLLLKIKKRYEFKKKR